MKWIKTNYKGEKEIWYSQDVIDQIKGYIDSYTAQCEECKDNRCCSSCFWGSACDLSDEILDVLNEQEGKQ